MLSPVMIDLFGRSLSCSSLFLMISYADDTGTDVNKVVTSYDVMHSPSSNLVFLISSANSFVLFTWQLEVPTSGFMILAISLATPYVTEPILETMGLRGISFLCIFGSP